MFHELHKSFDANLSRFQDWERLAAMEKNPHRRDDLITAAITAGKLEMIAAILRKEWSDDSRITEAENAAARVREIAESI